MGNTYPVPTDGEPMPWRTQTVKEQRIELVTPARKPGANISELARRSGVSRKTIYKWRNRDDMDDRSHRPKAAPSALRRPRKPVSSPHVMTIPPGARAKLPTSSRAIAASSLRRARSTASCAAMAVSTLRPVVPRLREAVFRASVSQRPVADGFQRLLQHKPRRALPTAGHPAIRATPLPPMRRTTGATRVCRWRS